jgi:signal transduction histidine kinase
MASERDLQTNGSDEYGRLRYRVSSLEGKLILTMAAITLLVVGGVTYLANQLTLDAVERNLTQTAAEVADAIALRLGSGFPETQVLQQVLIDYVHTNAEIEAVIVFSLSKDGHLRRLASAGTKIESFREQERAIETRAPVSRRVSVGGQHLWSLGVPIISEREPRGVVGVWSSLLAADLIMQQNRRRALIAAPLSVALIVLTLRVAFNRFVHSPLKGLEGAMSRAEAGDLQAEVPVVRKDELGFIAGRYNSMLSRIRNIIEERAELHNRVQQFNEELGAKVAESTRELKKKNIELRRLNRELYFLQRRLARIERLSAAEQVAAKFAHKIGTPLNLISGHIQVLQQTRHEDPELGEKLQLVQSQIEKLTAIVRDMLDETRKPVLDLQHFNVNELLNRIWAIVEPTFTSKGIRVEKHLTPDLALILGDEAQLEQVFLNLLNNSLDAMPEGGLITLRSRETGGKVRVELSDNGEGIQRSDLSQIYRPFFTTKEIGRGTGLGLAIVKEILTAHGATIVAKSEVGGGTTFTLEFPLAEFESMEEGRQ